MDVFKKSEIKKLTIPEGIFTKIPKEPPEKITIKYSNINEIPISDIDEAIRVRYVILKDQLTLDKYLKESEKHLENKNVSEFMKVAKRYIIIELLTINMFSNNCHHCGASLENIVESEDGSINCPKCKFCYNEIAATHYMSNANDIPIEPINNFTKIIDKYEGICLQKPPDSLYTQLDDYFQGTNCSRSIVEKKELLENGKKEGTNKDIMWKALEKTSNSHYYDDINYICHVYWGWALPDLKELRNQILEDYKKTQAIWLKIKEKYPRKASLGNQFRLLVHLKGRGYNGYISDREDFKIQDSTDSLRIHNAAWKEMAETSGIPYIYEVF